MDSGIVQRQTCCTLCGRSIWGSKPWFDIVDIGARSLPTLLCQPCQQVDPLRERLRAKLARRYAHEGGVQASAD